MASSRLDLDAPKVDSSIAPQSQSDSSTARDVFTPEPSIPSSQALTQQSDYDEPQDDGMDADQSSTSPGSTTPSEPRYSVDEIVAIMLDFYTFLTRLQFPPQSLRIAPPGGWPNIDRIENLREHKTDFVVELLRRLPYLDHVYEDRPVHYKSQIIDWSMYVGPYTPEDDPAVCYGHWGEQEDSRHVISLSEGHESGGRAWALDTLRGEIMEEEVRCDSHGPFDLREYFDKLKDDYRCLRLVPRLHGEADTVWEAWEVPEADRRISREEVRANHSEYLEVNLVRQTLRQCGWPHQFRLAEAESKIESLEEYLDS